jgi:hypothetical protein
MRNRFGYKMIPMVIVAIILATAAVMYLWNLVLVPVIGVGIVSYWQAMGILALSRILFGSKSKGRCHGHGHRCGNRSEYKKRWKEKYENLSEDEKDKMKGFFGNFKDEPKSE